MKIAILGARGFVGRNLAERLVLNGHDVVGYALKFRPDPEVKFECRSVYELINSDRVSKLSFDVVINLAARRSTTLNPLSAAEVNTFNFEIPKTFLLKTAGPGSLVINSSTYVQNFGGVIGQTVDSYGESKQKMSKFLEEESSIHHFRTLDLFFFTLYGLTDRPNHLIPLLLDAALTGKKILLSPGGQLLNLLYLDDAIQNIINCINKVPMIGYQRNYVWTNEYFSLKDIVDRIQTAIGRKIDCSWGARKYVGHEMMEIWPIPMEQLPCISAPTDLEQGINKIWKSVSRV